MLVVDTSGSMADEDKLPQAKKGLHVFLRQLSGRDRIGLMFFNATPQPLIPILPFATVRAPLERAIDALVADGDTALYDATAQAVDKVNELNDRARINAVVVLTDGADTASHLKEEDVLRRLHVAGGDEGTRVRVFTIAYGSDVGGSADALQQISQAAGGQAYKGDTEDIEAVYKSISSFF
jgi:Ca-activated chloride channel family protein